MYVPEKIYFFHNKNIFIPHTVFLKFESIAFIPSDDRMNEFPAIVL